MKLFSIALIIINGQMLMFIYNQRPDSVTLMLCLMLFGLSCALPFLTRATPAQPLVSLALVGTAGYILAHDVWWLDGSLAIMLPAVMVALVGMVYAWTLGMLDKIALRRRSQAMRRPV